MIDCSCLQADLNKAANKLELNIPQLMQHLAALRDSGEISFNTKDRAFYLQILKVMLLIHFAIDIINSPCRFLVRRS